MRTSLLAVVVGTLATASSAHALNQSKHYDITVQSCTAAGLPKAFCALAGANDYDVDANEWNDLAAHAQIPTGSGACQAADASVWRAFWFGGQLRAAALDQAESPSQAGAELLAQHLGRVLHLVQDDCAHVGMPNPQHAWHSLSDVCRGTQESPDVNPSAYVCARTDTDAVFAALVDTLRETGVATSSLAGVSTGTKSWPAHADVCNFLASAGDWDGQDRRWDAAVVRPALTAQLALGLSGADTASFQHVCRSDDDVLPRSSDPTLATSGGAQSCLTVHIYCLGKADENGAPTPPPWETDAASTTTPAPAASAASMTGGCAVAAGGASPVGAPLFAFVLALILRRARRRRV